MYKTNIIQSLAYINVPANTKLVEHRLSAFGSTNMVVSSFTSGNTSGLKILSARLLCKALEGATADLSNTPDAVLLRRLHESCIKWTTDTIQAIVIQGVKEGLVANHCKMIEHLAEVAKKLGLEYEQPQDLFLK